MRHVLALFLAAGAPALAEPDPVLGENIFQSVCASCHGADARGGGPLGDLLVVAPPDLTGLARANGGVFPVFRVVRQIDGRDPLLAHGGEMPLFGQFLDMPDSWIASEDGQPIITAAPIADVTAWLATVQE